MKQKEINWDKLKGDYHLWRKELYRLTKELLTSSGRFELSKYNEEGYFHHVSDSEYFKQMRMDWDREKRVPEKWISKGYLPGIWTAMFNPHNTYSIARLPIHIIRFYFKEGFFIYNIENRNHKKIFASWNESSRKNPWKILKNDRRESLEERMKAYKCPTHKSFYEDNKFGAIVGYSDYISPVIVLEEAIERIEFLEL
ncbi:unnamed protein product [marine sediment metagenome]|uniref:Uncharacterized protein n=1 Tax=marine sediment metagenome TaxID=412755 RepID=X0T664_9ZZZZ